MGLGGFVFYPPCKGGLRGLISQTKKRGLVFYAMPPELVLEVELENFKEIQNENELEFKFFAREHLTPLKLFSSVLREYSFGPRRRFLHNHRFFSFFMSRFYSREFHSRT